MTTTQPAALPELPEPDRTMWQHGNQIDHYTADQMRAYALAALQPQPAAQTEREAFEAWTATQPHGKYPLRRDQEGQYWADGTEVAWDAWQARASLPTQPAEQATPDVPEVCFGNKATPEPLTGCNCRWKGETQVEWCEHHRAHLDAIHEWAQRAKSAEAKLKATPEPVGEAVAWWYGTHPRSSIETIRLDHTFTDHAGEYIKGRPLVFGDAHPAPGVPDVEAAAKKLAECMDYPWEHMSSEGRDNMRKHAEAVLAAAQAKGGGHV